MESLYIIRSESFYKIGIARDVDSRLAQLQTGNPIPLTLWASYTFEAAITIERALHQKFRACRAVGEWFRLSEKDLEEAFRICELLGGIKESAGYVASKVEIEEAEIIQEEVLDGISQEEAWDFREMFSQGWKLEPAGNGRAAGHKKYWGWRRRREGESNYLYGGKISDLPLPIEEMRRVYNGT